MFASSSTITRAFTALVVIAAIGAGGAAATGGLFTAADGVGAVSPASTNDTVTASETVTFTVTVEDSANGNDTATGSLTVADSTTPGDVPSDFPATAEQFNAVAGDDGDISTFDLVDAIEGASDDGEYNGVEITTFDFVDIIGWNST